MARTEHSDFNPGATDSATHLQADSGARIELPDASFVGHAELLRDGADLILRAPDGQTVVIENYFAADSAPVLAAPNGAVLTPELVQSFVQGAHAQYAAIDQAHDASPVGVVKEVAGDATITRVDGSTEAMTVGMPVFEGDIIETGGAGAVNIVFIDETSFAVSSDARLAIDEYVFDPDSQSGTTDFSVLRGMFVFTSGLIGRDDPDDVHINTPVGSIGIRGTTIAGNATTGEITIIEGAIVLRAPGGQEMTLATQFETARFNPAGGGVEHVGTLSSDQVGQNFATMGSVAPAFFVAIGQSEPLAGGAEAANGGGAAGSETGGTGAANGATDADSAPANAEPPAPTPDDGQSFNDNSSFGTQTPFDSAAGADTVSSGAAAAGTAGAAPAATTPASGTAGAGTGAASAGAAGIDNTVPATPPSVLNGGTTGGGTTAPVVNTAAPVIGNPYAAFNVNENSAAATVVGAVAATDVDGNTLTYSITAGNTGNVFAIDGSGNITVNGALDYEAAGTYNLTVQVSDGLYTDSSIYTIGINDINEAPTATAGTVAPPAEDAAIGMVVYDFNATDPEGTALTYSIVSGNTGSAFAIDSTGQVTIAAALDYETLSTYTLLLRASDGTNSVDQTITVNVGNEDDAAPVLNANNMAVVTENSSVTITTAMLSYADSDTPNPANLTYVLSGGLNYGQVELTTNPGVAVTSFTQADIDAGHVIYVHGNDETHTTDSFLFTVTDSGGNSATSQTFNLQINLVNDAPTLTAAGATLDPIDEDDTASAGTSVSDFNGGTFDPETGTTTGIAITGVDNSDGQWQYFNGSVWVNITGVSPTAALLLDSADLVRFVPDADFAGAATFDYKAWDGTSGTAYGTGNTMAGTAFSAGSDTATITVDGLNDMPAIDLDADNSAAGGADYAAVFSGTPVSIADIDAAITDPDNATMQTMTITLSSMPDGAAEYLQAASGNGTHANGIIISGSDSGVITLSFTGGAPISAFLDVLAEITYTNNAGTPTTGMRDITVTVTDADGAVSDPAHSQIDVQSAATTHNGTTGNDTLTGNAGDEVFYNSQGDDSYDGGGGIDTIDFSDAAGPVVVSLSAGQITNDGYGAVTETLVNFENVTGGDGADMITGDTQANILRGGAGADTIDGGGGADVIYGEGGNDVIAVIDGYAGATINGGADYDVYDAQSVTNAMLLDVASGQATRDSGTNIDNISGVEEFWLGNGDDTIMSADGDYIFNGSAGSDTIDFSGIVSGLSVDLNTGVVAGPSWTQTLSNIENVTGTGYDDTIAGDGNDNTIIAGNGNDTVAGSMGNDILDGGAGYNTLDFSAFGDTINVDLVGGTVTYDSYTAYIENFQVIIAGASDDNFDAADGQTQEIRAGAGNDILQGGAGDLLFGEADADTLQFGTSYSGMTIDGGVGIDKLSILESGTYDFANLAQLAAVEIIDLQRSGVAASLTISVNSTMMATLEGGTLEINMDADDSLDLDLSGLTGYRIVGGGTAGQDTIRIQSADGTQNIVLHFDPATNDINIQGLGPATGVYLNALDSDKGFILSDFGAAGLGYTVFAAGDRDGDGRADLAFTKAQGIADDGRIYFYDSTGASYDTQNLASAGNVNVISNILAGAGSTIDMAAASAGDFNGDGITDYVVGSSTAQLSGVNTGNAQVINGADGTVLHNFIGMDVTNLFGMSVAGVGDINNDGFDDVLVGMPGYSSGTFNGGAYLAFGNGTGGTTDFNNPAAADGLFMVGIDNEKIGSTVAAAGDFNNDGIADFMVGGGDITGTNNGVVHVVFGDSDMDDIDLGSDSFTITGIDVDGGNRHVAMAGLGDINGDGISDIGVGATGGAGELHVFLGANSFNAGNATSVSAANLNIQAASGWEIVGGGAAGDFNGDGYDDIAVAFHQTGGDALDIYVVYGSPTLSGTLDNNALNDPAKAYHINYTIPDGVDYDNVDVTLGQAGDINGDGYSDLAIGISAVDNDASSDSDGNSTATDDADGLVAVVYGGASGSVNASGASTAANQILVGDAGNNTLTQTAAGHTDLSFLGGAGDDTVGLIDDSFRDINLGLGHDSIDFLTDAGTLDFSHIGTEKVQGLEEFHFAGNNQTLRLTIQDVLSLMNTSDDGTLTISAANNTNHVEIDGDAPYDGTSQTALASALGADGVTDTRDANYWDFSFGGHTLSIEKILVANNNVDVT